MLGKEPNHKAIFHFIYLGAVKGFGFVVAGKLGHIPDNL